MTDRGRDSDVIQWHLFFIDYTASLPKSIPCDATSQICKTANKFLDKIFDYNDRNAKPTKVAIIGNWMYIIAVQISGVFVVAGEAFDTTTWILGIS